MLFYWWPGRRRRCRQHHEDNNPLLHPAEAATYSSSSSSYSCAVVVSLRGTKWALVKKKMSASLSLLQRIHLFRFLSVVQWPGPAPSALGFSVVLKGPSERNRNKKRHSPCDTIFIAYI